MIHVISNTNISVPGPRVGGTSSVSCRVRLGCDKTLSLHYQDAACEYCFAENGESGENTMRNEST